MNLTRNHEVVGSIPGLTQWVKDPVLSCSVGHRHSSDPPLLWMWHRPAAVAPIRPLAWEPPYAVYVALKEQKDKKKKKSKTDPTKYTFYKNPALKVKVGVPVVAQWLTNPPRNHEVSGSVPGLAQWVKGSGIAVSCGVGCRHSSDPALL